MKDARLVLAYDPCVVPLDDPTIQSERDLQGRKIAHCTYYPPRTECSPPRRGCVALAGTRVARHVLQFYSEATARTLALEVERFVQEAPLPPNRLEGYAGPPERGYGLVTDPALVVALVRAYAEAVLSFKAGERVFRSPEEDFEPSAVSNL